MKPAVEAVETGRAMADRFEGGQQFVSVIVPVTSSKKLASLYHEFSRPLRETGRRFEFLFIIQGSVNSALDSLVALSEEGQPVRILEVAQDVGEASLVKIGGMKAEGNVFVTLPTYRRVVPEAIPHMLEALSGGTDLVVARRWPRRDSWINRFQTRLFHAFVGRLAEHRIHDVACGVIAMRRNVLMDMPLYGDFFRFFPLFALRGGFRLKEVNAPQHPEDVRTKVYHPGVYIRRLLDILGLVFLLRFTYKPLRFFGLVGAMFLVTGGVVLIILLIERLGGQGIANRPMLLLGGLLVVLGFQSVALGLIGEIIVHLRASRRGTYRIRSHERSRL